MEKRIIYNNGASIKGKGIGHSRKRFEVHVHEAFKEYGTNELYCLFGDFSKFYDNIIHEIAKKQLLSLFKYNELGIHINEKKTCIGRLDKVNRYLQVKYTLKNTGHLIKRINPKRVTKMRQKMKGLKRKLDHGETICESIEEMFRSWMGSFYKIMSKEQRLQLIKMFEELFNRKVILKRQSDKWKMFIEEVIT